MLYAAAVLTKFRPVFHRTYKKQLDFLVADIATKGGMEMAKHFPTARQKVRGICMCMRSRPSFSIRIQGN